MQKYLIEASYQPEGARGLIREGGSSRREAIDKMVKQYGGRLEAFYFAFGDSDVYTIIELPDAVAASALALSINQSGAVRIRTIVLITPEEVDQAVKRTMEYRAPGK